MQLALSCGDVLHSRSPGGMQCFRARRLQTLDASVSVTGLRKLTAKPSSQQACVATPKQDKPEVLSCSVSISASLSAFHRKPCRPASPTRPWILRTWGNCNLTPVSSSTQSNTVDQAALALWSYLITLGVSFLPLTVSPCKWNRQVNTQQYGSLLILFVFSSSGKLINIVSLYSFIGFSLQPA